MRSLRAKKYRKKYKKLIILSQILAIWYVTAFTTAMLTSDTFAFFSTSDQTQISIQTGGWWDGSDLELIVKNTENIKACPPTDISVDIKNNGFDMIDTTEFEVYYIENGNPKNNGEKVHEGYVESIKSGDTFTLTYEAKQTGSYMFKVLQRPGYNDDYDNRVELWSKKLMVKCLEDEDIEDEDELTEEEITEEIIEEISEPVENDNDTVIETDEKQEADQTEEATKKEKKEEKKEKINEAKDKAEEDKKNVDSNKGKKDESEEVIESKSIEKESEPIEEGDES